jgi:hypothetical protein
MLLTPAFTDRPSLTDPSFRPNVLGSNAGPAATSRRYTPDGRVIPQGGSSTAPPEGRRHECQSSATHAGVISHQHAHLAEQVRVLTARVAEIKAVLRHVEWSSFGDCCPQCNHIEEDGHAVHCALAAALRT